MAQLYFDKVAKHHGVPKTIVSDRNIKFTSYFWKTLWQKLGTLLKFSTAFHPQSDGQTEVVNRSLENLLRCLVGDHQGTWDLILPRAQFAYNISVNRSTGLSPHEIVYGHKPRAPIDLIPMSPLRRASESAETFACRMYDLHKSINNQITMNNAKYKSTTDAHRRYKCFEIGNFVMIRLRPERFPPGTFSKLQARGMGPFEVLSKVGENGYVIDIPNDWGIHSTFNIEDLVAYKWSIDRKSVV